MANLPLMDPGPRRAPVEAAPVLVELQGVGKQFGSAAGFFARTFRPRTASPVSAVDNVDLTIRKGEVLGLVGESGSGKSTVGRLAAGITGPTSGRVLWKGVDRAALRDQEAKQARLGVQMIFQNAYASLNPRMPVRDIIGEAPLVHGLVEAKDLDAYVDAQMRRAGLDPAWRGRYAHQFSGGQRQRIGIARALAVQPEMLVCDESVAALDVSIQAQIINLFLDLRRDLRLTSLFISHDLGVVEHVSDRVAVMYFGRIVEEACTESLYRAPNHPYTQALLNDAPRISNRNVTFRALDGEMPSALDMPMGCSFCSRCPKAMPRCATEPPILRSIGPGHRSACHLNDDAV